MAGLEFNLFDELENSDPRVEHFWQSRLSAYQKLGRSNGDSCRSHGEPDGESKHTRGERTNSRRIHIARIPTSILDVALKETLGQFGTFVNYRRQRDSRPGFVGLTYAHASFDSPEAAANAISGLRQLEFEGTKLLVKSAQDRSDKSSTMPVNTITNDDNALRLNQPVKVAFQPVDISLDKQLYFLSDGQCSVIRTPTGKWLEPKIHDLEAYLNSNMNQIGQSHVPYSVSVGQDVLAIYEGQFYRALVLSQLTTSQFQVWFTDYCNVTIVRIDSIRQMNDAVRDICPRLGHFCQLAQIKPTLDSGYFEEALEWMSGFITQPSVVTTVVVVAQRAIPNGVTNMVQILVTNLATNKTANLAEEMIKKRYGFPTNSSASPPPPPPSDPYPVKFSELRFRKASDFQSRRPFQAEIVHFVSPSDFWLIEESESHQLADHQDMVQRAAGRMAPLEDKPGEGDMVLASWTDGATPVAFYRAVVRKLYDDSHNNNNNTRLRVHFVDYGNIDDIDSHHIRPLSEDLARFPMQALRCCFAGLTPSAWSSKARKDTRKILTDCESILCEVRDQEPPDDLSHRKFKVVLRGADLKALNERVGEVTRSEATPSPQQQQQHTRSSPLQQSTPAPGSQATPPSQPQAEKPFQDFSSARFCAISSTDGFSDNVSHPNNNNNKVSHPNPHSHPTAHHNHPHSTPHLSQTGPSTNGDSGQFNSQNFGRPAVPNHRSNNSPSSTNSRPHPPSSSAGDRSFANGLSSLPGSYPEPRSASLSSNGSLAIINNNNSPLCPASSSRTAGSSIAAPLTASSQANSSSNAASLASANGTTTTATLLPVSANEELLQDRVDALERHVAEQDLQIRVLNQSLEAKEAVESRMEQRLENMEAGLNLIKRNHEALELDLVKKKIL